MPHPARREVTWRYWYGLTQAWGSTTYDWALGQILPRCGEEVLSAEPDRELCQREDTGLPWGKPYRGRIHIWDYPDGNQAIRIPRPVQGLTGDPGELTPVLGLASDCSTQSDCRGCLEDSTRVHRPGNWTGGEKRHSYPWVRGNGAASMTPASSSRPLLTQHTGRNWLNAEIVESRKGVRCRPTRSSADVCQRGAVRQRMGGGNTPSGVSTKPPGGTARLATGTPRRRPPLSSGPTSVWRQPSLSAALRGRQRAAQSFWRSRCGPRICAMLLRDTATLRLDLPPPRVVLAGSPPDRQGRGGNLGHVSRLGSQDNVRVDRPEHKALFAYQKCLEVPDPFDGSEHGQERCLKRQEL